MLHKFNYERFLDAACRNGFTSIDIGQHPLHFWKVISYETLQLWRIHDGWNKEAGRKCTGGFSGRYPGVFFPQEYLISAGDFRNQQRGTFIKVFPLLLMGFKREWSSTLPLQWKYSYSTVIPVANRSHSRMQASGCCVSYKSKSDLLSVRRFVYYYEIAKNPAQLCRYYPNTWFLHKVLLVARYLQHSCYIISATPE